MKTVFMLTVIFGTISGHFAFAAPATYTLDLKKSKVSWAGKVMGAQMAAQVGFQSGTLVIDQTKEKKGLIVVDLNSLTTDSGMDAQLKGPMLLNVAAYPTATLEIKTLEEVHPFAPGGPNTHASGTGTFRGKSKPAEGDFVMNKTSQRFHAVGKFKTIYGNIVDGEVSYDILLTKSL